MKMNRFHRVLLIAAGLTMLEVVPGFARGAQAQSSTAPNPTSPSPPKAASLEDYFAGLDYTDEQKEEIDKIKQEMEAKKAIVAKDAKLDAYQKDAMIQGYTRLGYAEIFRLLTPAQQKVVHQRMAANRQANKGPKRPAVPTPPSK
jgi:hypothetical protein